MKKHLILLGMLMISSLAVLSLEPRAFDRSKVMPAEVLQSKQAFQKANQGLLSIRERSGSTLNNELPGIPAKDNLVRFNSVFDSNRPVRSERRLTKAPEYRTKAKAPEGDNVQWGEWYALTSGTLQFENFITDDLYGVGSYPKHIEVMRRDAEGSDAVAQIKFVEALGDLDLIGDYNPKTFEINFERVDLGKRLSFADYGYDVTFGITQPELFFPGWAFTSNAWFFVIPPGMGYNVNMYFYPDNAKDKTINASFDRESINSDNATFKISKVSSDLAQVKYTVLRYPYDSWISDADQKAGNNILTSVYDLLAADDPSLDIRTLTQSEAAGHVETITFEEAGPYCIYIMAEDENGYRAVSGSLAILAMPLEEGKWRPIGKGTFTDVSYGQLMNIYFSYNDNFEYPDWTNENTWTVDVEESVDVPGKYRVMNPYRGNCPYQDLNGPVQIPYEGYEYSYNIVIDQENDYYLILHGENPDNVWTEFTSTGMYLVQEETINSEKYTTTYDVSYTSMEGVDENVYLPKDFESHALTYSNLRFEGGYNTDNRRFAVTLPGYINYDTKFESDLMNVTATLGSDYVDHISYMASVIYRLSDEEAFSIIEEGTAPEVRSQSVSGDMDLGNLEAGRRYTLYSVSFDKNGNAVSRQKFAFTPQPRHYVYYGEAFFYDDGLVGGEIPAQLYKDSDNMDAEIFYMYNPYSIYANFDNSYDNYATIDCTDHYHVVFEPFNTGISAGQYNYMLGNLAGIYLYMGYDATDIPDNYYGTFEWGRADFGATGFLIEELDELYGPYNGYVCQIPGYEDRMIDIIDTVDGYYLNFHKDATQAVVTVVPEADFLEAYGKMMAGDYTGLDVATYTESGLIDISKWQLKAFDRYHLLVVSTSNDGRGAYSAYRTLMGEPEYVCDAIVTECYLQAFGMENYIYQRQVFINPDRPDVYYIRVDYPDYGYIGGNYYIILNCTDYNRIYLEDSNIGIGNYSIMSSPSVPSEIIGEDIPDSHYGTFDGITATIPGVALVLADNHESYFGIFTPENSEDFRAEFSRKMSGVDNVSVENNDGKVKYYDITGRIVTAPQKGNLYIMKKGDDVKKIIF